MGNRKWTAEQKMSIVLEGIRGENSISEICRNHSISQTQYYKWRDSFYRGAMQELSGKKARNESSLDKAKVNELERIIGKQTIAIEILKKTQDF